MKIKILKIFLILCQFSALSFTGKLMAVDRPEFTSDIVRTFGKDAYFSLREREHEKRVAQDKKNLKRRTDYFLQQKSFDKNTSEAASKDTNSRIRVLQASRGSKALHKEKIKNPQIETSPNRKKKRKKPATRNEEEIPKKKKPRNQKKNFSKDAQKLLETAYLTDNFNAPKKLIEKWKNENKKNFTFWRINHKAKTGIESCRETVEALHRLNPAVVKASKKLKIGDLWTFPIVGQSSHSPIKITLNKTIRCAFRVSLGFRRASKKPETWRKSGTYAEAKIKGLYIPF